MADKVYTGDVAMCVEDIAECGSSDEFHSQLAMEVGAPAEGGWDLEYDVNRINDRGQIVFAVTVTIGD